MKSLHVRGAAALAVAALVGGVGYQTAFGSEAGAGREAPSAAKSLQVSYHGKSLNARLSDIVAVSADEGWAAGMAQNDNGSELKPILVHRKGKDWKPASIPGAGEDTFIQRIEASGPDNVWAFGSKGQGEDQATVAFRYDGQEWKAVKVPVENDKWDGPRPAAVIAEDDVWLLGGEQDAYHFDGEKWTKTKLAGDAWDVDATKEGDVWAVGYRDTDDGSGGPMSQPIAMHWDGKKWQTTKTPEYHFPAPAPPEETAGLEAVVAVSEKEVWAVGPHTFNHGETDPEPEDEQILLRWDGSKWKGAPKKIADKAQTHMASDGDGGLMLDDRLHMTKDGTLHKIGKHQPLVPGRSGKVEDVDKKQGFVGNETVLVPGTRQLWSAGEISLGSHGDANFSRDAVVTYDAG